MLDQEDIANNYYGDHTNPLEGTTKINDETSNTTNNYLLGHMVGSDQKY